MKFYILLLICCFIADFSSGNKDGFCVRKLRKGRWVNVGDCQNQDDAKTLQHLRQNVAKKTWYKARNNFYYKLFHDKVNYATAKSNCQKQGADLASVGIRDSTVRNKILELVKSGGDHAWIGLDDIEDEGIFIWADGVVSTDTNTDWMGGGHDDSGNEDCVHVFRDLLHLNDISCTVSMKYICEIKV